MDMLERFESVQEKYNITHDTAPLVAPLHDDNHIALFMILSPFKYYETDGIIDGADHDIIYLNINKEKLMEASDEIIHDIIVYGGFYSEEYDAICRFV